MWEFPPHVSHHLSICPHRSLRSWRFTSPSHGIDPSSILLHIDHHFQTSRCRTLAENPSRNPPHTTLRLHTAPYLYHLSYHFWRLLCKCSYRSQLAIHKSPFCLSSILLHTCHLYSYPTNLNHGKVHLVAIPHKCSRWGIRFASFYTEKEFHRFFQVWFKKLTVYGAFFTSVI